MQSLTSPALLCVSEVDSCKVHVPGSRALCFRVMWPLGSTGRDWEAGRSQGSPSPPALLALRGVSGSDSSEVLPALGKLVPAPAGACSCWAALTTPSTSPFDPLALQLRAADSCCCSCLHCLTVPSALPTLAMNYLHGTTWCGLCFPDGTLSLVQRALGL